MRKPQNEVVKEPIYGNCKILAPDEQVLSRCDLKKVNWYLEKGLAVKVADDPPTIKLNFEPSGRTDADDPFLMSDKPNRCVCCNAEEGITRHHIVPYCFRKHLPEKLKTHNCYDIVPLCLDCHHKYEHHAFEKKKEIAKSFGICVHGEGWVYNNYKSRVKKHAATLLRNRDKIPFERQEALLSILREYYGKQDITEADLLEAYKLEVRNKNSDYKEFGQCVIEKTTNIQEFIVEWRKHFLEHMKPKFLSPLWDPERRLR